MAEKVMMKNKIQIMNLIFLIVKNHIIKSVFVLLLDIEILNALNHPFVAMRKRSMLVYLTSNTLRYKEVQHCAFESQKQNLELGTYSTYIGAAFE